tara:strand:- start:10 stop:750 length:741 start_codon:yes stop_codon:yes gene_type:complete
MPNWCWNNLNVSGNEKQLQKFVEKSMSTYDDGTERFIFNGTYPMPKTLRITAGSHLSFIEKIKRYINIKLYGHDNWYNWSIANWGTKWDASEPSIQHNDIDYFSVSFETAWAPPVDWIDHIMQDFPDLCFELEYQEEGMGFGGLLQAQYETTWEDAHWEIDQASECCKGEVYNSDDEEFSLSKIPLKILRTWTGKDKTWKTVKDIPEYLKYPDYQCGICGEQCETISINVADIKPAKIKINESNEN